MTQTENHVVENTPSAGRRADFAEKNKGYLPTLDGWRAVAIFGVMAAHASNAALSPESFGYRLLRRGDLGVDLFFGISGFLITSRLLEESRRRGGISLPGFYVRRCCRILPPYLTYLAVIGGLALAGMLALNGAEFLSCLFFYRNYLAPHDLGGWYTGHFWSLSVEEHFYLFWPFFLVGFGIMRARWLLPALALLLAAWRALDFRFRWVEMLLPGVGFFDRTDIRIDALLWAGGLALLLDAPGWKDRLTRWLSPGVWLVVVAGLVFCVVVSPPLKFMWQSLLIPLILAGTVLRPNSLMGWVLECSLLRWLGRLSYSLYLWQQLFLVQRGVPRPFGFVQEWPTNILAVFACATASYYLIERPMVRLGHRLAAPVTPGRV